MQAVSIEKIQRHARTVFSNLMPFLIMMSTTEEKQDAIANISELRMKLEKQFDIICPGWEETGD